MKLLSSIQNTISKKDINDIVYNKDLIFPRLKSELSTKLNIDYWSMIDEPPKNDSKITTQDLTQILSLANNRTIKETELVFLVDNDPLKLFYAFLTQNQLVFRYKKFRELYVFLYEIISDIKSFYNRARPFQLSDFYGIKLDVIITKSHHTASYPSGHTAYAALAACILSEDYPEYSDDFWHFVEEVAKARILQGVHFASDNSASMSLVQRVYKKLVEFDRSHFN